MEKYIKKIFGSKERGELARCRVENGDLFLTDTRIALKTNLCCMADGNWFFENKKLVRKLIEGKFPDLERYRPTTIMAEWELETKEMLQLLKTVNVIGKLRSGMVRLFIEKNLTTRFLFAKDSADENRIEGAITTVRGLSKGADLDIWFNGAVLFDFLELLKRQKINSFVVQFMKSTYPLQIVFPGGYFLLMPMTD